MNIPNRKEANELLIRIGCVDSDGNPACPAFDDVGVPPSMLIVGWGCMISFMNRQYGGGLPEASKAHLRNLASHVPDFSFDQVIDGSPCPAKASLPIWLLNQYGR